MSKTRELKASKKTRKSVASAEVKSPAKKTPVKLAKSAKTARLPKSPTPATSKKSAKPKAVKKPAPAKSVAKPAKATIKKAAVRAKPLAAAKKSAAAKTPPRKKPATQSTRVKSPIANTSSRKPNLPVAQTGAEADGPAKVSQAASNKSQRPRAKIQRSKAEVVLPEGYRPSENEPFMSPQQHAYFRSKLIAWKEDIIRQTRETLQVLTLASEQHADVSDRATSETDRALELRARDRQRKLVSKINAAIARIDDGSYGYCEESGEPIGLRRLEARPIATLSLEAQERHERRERVFRED